MLNPQLNSLKQSLLSLLKVKMDQVNAQDSSPASLPLSQSTITSLQNGPTSETFKEFHKRMLMEMMRLKEERRQLQNDIAKGNDGIDTQKNEVDAENRKLQALNYEQSILLRQVEQKRDHSLPNLKQLVLAKAPQADQNSLPAMALSNLSTKSLNEHGVTQEQVLQFINRQHDERTSLAQELKALEQKKQMLLKQQSGESRQIAELKEQLGEVVKAVRPVMAKISESRHQMLSQKMTEIYQKAKSHLPQNNVRVEWEYREDDESDEEDMKQINSSGKKQPPTNSKSKQIQKQKDQNKKSMTQKQSIDKKVGSKVKKAAKRDQQKDYFIKIDLKFTNQEIKSQLKRHIDDLENQKALELIKKVQRTQFYFHVSDDFIKLVKSSDGDQINGKNELDAFTMPDFVMPTTDLLKEGAQDEALKNLISKSQTLLISCMLTNFIMRQAIQMLSSHSIRYKWLQKTLQIFNGKQVVLNIKVEWADGESPPFSLKRTYHIEEGQSSSDKLDPQVQQTIDELKTWLTGLAEVPENKEE